MNTKVHVSHFPNCTHEYPEKVPGEKAQKLEKIDLDDHEYVLQCVDCGAHSEVQKDYRGVE